MNTHPRIREIIGKRLEGLRLHLIAGPDCGGWSDLTNAERRKQDIRDEIKILENWLIETEPKP